MHYLLTVFLLYEDVSEYYHANLKIDCSYVLYTFLMSQFLDRKFLEAQLLYDIYCIRQNIGKNMTIIASFLH